MTEGSKEVEKCMSKKLIILDQYFSWEGTIYNCLKHVLRESFIGVENQKKKGVTDKLIDFLKKERPEVKLDADASWLDDYIYKLYNGTPFIAKSLACKILNRRMYLLAYHACRPTDIKSYYEKGLIPLNKKYIRDYFNQKNYPNITKERLDSAIKNIRDPEIRFGKSYFVTNPEIIYKRDNHYLKKGSECLSFVASKCDVGLKADAQPTFFVCSVPVLFIPMKLLKELSALLLNILFLHILKRKVNWNELHYDFYIEKRLSKDNIVGHFCPAIGLKIQTQKKLSKRTIEKDLLDVH
jgi:hypothetical protein